MSKVIYLILSAVVITLVSCSGMDGEIKKVPAEMILSGTFCAIDTKREEVINNKDEYDKLMKDVYANLDQVPKTPFVNFEKNTLVAVFTGARNSGGYMVNIDSITEGSKNLTVFVTETKPGKSCVVTDAITKPFVIVKIPKTDKKPVYKYNEIVNECQ
ncbi:MAG: protease complex subunit PrcB family protein [Ignavibacteria bacterium]|nr:protease complex subunit PrcB family protein [Ignavibacteria bacterium]